MAKSFYTGTDAQLLEGAQNFSTLITATPTAFGLVAGQATAYATVNTAYATSYHLAKDPATRTPVTVAAKNTARTNLKTQSKSLGEIVRATLTVSDAQLISLGLLPRSTRQPIPAPTEAPGLDVIGVNAWTVQIRLHETGSGLKRGKPAGVSGASVFSYVGATPPGDIASWQFEGNTGKVTKIDVVFPNTIAAGAKVWLTAFWFNGRKQSGPACDPVSANLPGGGVSLAA